MHTYQVTLGLGYDHPVLLQLVLAVLYGVQVRRHCWPCHMRHPHFLKSILKPCGDVLSSMNRKWRVCWWNWGMMMFLGCLWGKNKNQINILLTGDASPDCCTFSNKPNRGGLVDLGVSLTLPSSATPMTIISMERDPTLSWQDSRPMLLCPGHMQTLRVLVSVE